MTVAAEVKGAVDRHFNVRLDWIASTISSVKRRMLVKSQRAAADGLTGGTPVGHSLYGAYGKRMIARRG
jgi:hypothetical protein